MYKLRHNPTGLYYQPHKHRSSNLSKRGKIYQTNNHGLSSDLREAKKNEDFETRTVRVQCRKNSQIHKLTEDKLVWKECRWSYNDVIADTLLKDWEKEQI